VGNEVPIPPAYPHEGASKEAWVNYARLLLGMDWTGRQVEYVQAVEHAIQKVLALGGTRQECFHEGPAAGGEHP
jgi:hypothetical protein